MSEKRFKIVYTEGTTFDKDVEFQFDCENEEQLDSIIQIALVSPNQINYVFDNAHNRLIASNDPNLYQGIEKYFSNKPPFSFCTKSNDVFIISIQKDKFVISAPFKYDSIDTKERVQCISEVVEFLNKRFPTLVSALPYDIQYLHTDRFTVMDFESGEPYIFTDPNYQFNVSGVPDHPDEIICEDIHKTGYPNNPWKVLDYNAMYIAKFTLDEINRNILISGQETPNIRVIRVHNTEDYDVLYNFRCCRIEEKSVTQLVSAEISLKLQFGYETIGAKLIIPNRGDAPNKGIDVYIQVPKVCEGNEGYTENKIILNVRMKYLGLIKEYCSTMLRDINETYREYKVEYREELTDIDFALDKADPITDPNLDNALMAMQVIIDDHVLHLSLKTDDNYVNLYVVSQDDAWYFDKGELYTYYVMNKIAQEFDDKFPNRGFTFFTNTDCRGSQSYEYVIQYREMDCVSTFDDFYVHIVVPEGDIYCGPNVDMCGDDHFDFCLSEPNQNMCHEDYLKLKEKYFRIYSKEFKNFYMKYSAE